MIKILTTLFALFMVILIAWADSGYAWRAVNLLMQMPHGDKAAHFLLLGTLSFLVNLSLDCRKITVFGHNIPVGNVLIAIVITLEEGSQAFIPHRNFEILDIVCNYAGIFTFGKAAIYYAGKNRTTFSV